MTSHVWKTTTATSHFDSGAHVRVDRTPKFNLLRQYDGQRACGGTWRHRRPRPARMAPDPRGWPRRDSARARWSGAPRTAHTCTRTRPAEPPASSADSERVAGQWPPIPPLQLPPHHHLPRRRRTGWQLCFLAARRRGSDISSSSKAAAPRSSSPSSTVTRCCHQAASRRRSTAQIHSIAPSHRTACERTAIPYCTKHEYSTQLSWPWLHDVLL